MLSDIPATDNPRVLVDFRTSDDAGVYAWEAGPALVQTVDFFTPIVDDPYLFGRIAAANALSDVYAMGGQPLTALAIAGFPATGIDGSDIKEIFRGGHDALAECGVALLGGHTVKDPELKFGYAITGAVEPGRQWTNAGARPGDALVLTKPIGTGIIGTAIKFARADERDAQAATASMCRTNRVAADCARQHGNVHACTDITGFGLAGHALEMAQASGVQLVLDLASIPQLPGAADLLAANRSGGLATNRTHVRPHLRVDATAETAALDLVFDPQTSGGLLLAVPAASATALVAALRAQGELAAAIGVAVERMGPDEPSLVIR